MACNTLLNATEHFKKLNLLGELRSVAPEDYNTVEQEIKDLEKLFKEKYGIVDSFFDLKMVQTPTIARDNPKVRVAVRACAATVEIPNVVATLKFIAAHISFALDRTVILNAPSAESCFWIS